MSGLDEALQAAARGGAPQTIALMRVLGEATTETAAREGLERMSAALKSAGDDAGSERLAVLGRLWAAHPDAWSVVRGALALAAHDRPQDAGVVQYWADTFDRLAAASPEASVALYSLGSPALLGAATDEIVGFMERQGLLGSAVDVLDLGCGIGRFLLALAPKSRSVLGLDVSAGMVAEARRRCAGLGNVRVAQGSGHDLDDVADGSLDLVLAADVFPYLVQAGEGLAARHIAAFGRVLRPAGAALILNYSYRGDRSADRADIEAAAAPSGLTLERTSTADFTTWDGATFLLRRV